MAELHPSDLEVELQSKLERQLQERFEKEFAAERERLETIHDQNIASITEELRTQHKKELDELRIRHDAVLNSKRTSNEDAIKDAMQARSEEIKLHFKAEYAKKSSEKNAEIILMKTKCEESIQQINEAWEVRLAEALKSCRRELDLNYSEIINQLKSSHREELKSIESARRVLLAQVKSLNQDIEEKRQSIESKNDVLVSLSKECDHHLESLEACKAPYIQKIEDLSKEIQNNNATIKDLEETLQERAREIAQARESLCALKEEHKDQVQLLQNENQDISGQEDALKGEVVLLQTKLSKCEHENRELQERLLLEVDSLKKQGENDLDKLSGQYEKEIATLKEKHLASLSSLRTESQIELTALQSQHDALQKEFSLKASEDLSRQISEHQELMEKKERGHKEELRKLRLASEQELHDTKIAHIHEISNMNKSFQRKEEELSESYIQKYKAISAKHEEKIRSLMMEHQNSSKQVEEIWSSKLKDAKELLNAVKASFGEQMIGELKKQKEDLDQEHARTLSQQELRLSNDFHRQMEEVKSGLQEEHTEKLAKVHNDASLSASTRLQAAQKLFIEDKENALTTMAEDLESRHQQEIEKLKDMLEWKMSQEKQQSLNELKQILESQHRQAVSKMLADHQSALDINNQRLVEDYQRELTRQIKDAVEKRERELTLEHEKNLAELENEMASERKTQMAQLKEKHEREISDCEASVRSRMTTEHQLKISEMTYEHQKDRETALSALRKEISDTHEQQEQDIKRRYESQKDKALANLRKEVEREFSQREVDLKVSHNMEREIAITTTNEEMYRRLAEQEEELKSEQTASLRALREDMEALAKQHEEDLQAHFSSEMDRELESLRNELEGRHAEELEDAVSQCNADKENALAALRSEMEDVFAEKEEKARSDLQAYYDSEKEVALATLSSKMEDISAQDLAKLKMECLAEKEASLESLRREMEKNMAGKEAEMRTQLESLQSQSKEMEVVFAEKEAEFKVQSDQRLKDAEVTHDLRVAALREQHQAELDTLETQHSLEMDTKIRESRENQVSDHLARFKEVTEKIQVVHRSEIESLKKENKAVYDRGTEALEQLREELTAEHHNELAELSLEQEREMSKLQATYQEKLGELQNEVIKHAQKMEDYQRELTRQIKDAVEKRERELTFEHEKNLVELENEWASERKRQMAQLKEKHEREISDCEASVRSRMTTEHQLKISEMTYEHQKDRETALSALRKEISDTNEQQEQDIKRRYESQKDKALANLRKEVESEFSQREVDLKVSHDMEREIAITATNEEMYRRLAEQEEELKSEQTASLRALREDMETLAKQHEEDLQAHFSSEMDRELESLRNELEGRHAEELEDAVSQCNADKENALAALRSEMEDVFAEKEEKARSDLQAYYDSEKEVALATLGRKMEEISAQDLAKLKMECLAEKEASLESIRKEMEKNMAGKEAEMRTQLESLQSQSKEMEVVFAEKEAEFKVQSDQRLKDVEVTHDLRVAALREQHQAELDTLETQHSLEMDTKIRESRENQVSDHLARFKEVTEKIQVVHRSEIESLKKENKAVYERGTEALEQLREELTAKHHKELAELSLEQEREMSKLQATYQEKLGELQNEVIKHAQKMEEAEENHIRAEREGREHAVRLELAQVSNDLSSKLVSSQSQNTELSRQLEALKEDLRRGQIQLETNLETYQKQYEALKHAGEAEQSSSQLAIVGEADDLRQKVVKMEEMMEAKENKNVKLMEEYNQELQQLKEAMALEVTKLKDELDSANSEVKTATQKLENSESERIRLVNGQHLQELDYAKLCQINLQLQKQVQLLEQEVKSPGAHLHREDTLNPMHEEIKKLIAEKDALRSKLASLEKCVVSIIKLSFMVQSVLGRGNSEVAADQATPTHTPKPAGSVSNEESSDHTPHHVLSTDSVDISPGSHSIASDESIKDGWNRHKTAPSMDSGLASNATTLLRSEGTTLMETPASSTAMSISNLPPLSLDLVEGGVASVSGTTMGGEEFDPDPHPHGLVQDGNIPAHVDPFSVSPINQDAVDDLSILPLDTTTASTAQNHGLIPFPMDATTQDHGLSILPLDTTVTHSVNVSNLSFDNTNTSTMVQAGDVSEYQTLLTSLDPASVQSSLSHFHDIVCTLVHDYTSATAQIGNYEMKLAELQAQLSLVQSQGAGLKDKEAELFKAKLLLEQRNMELKEALEKIQNLEAAGRDLPDDLVEETEALIQSSKDQEEVKILLSAKIEELESECQSQAAKLEEMSRCLQQERENTREVQKELRLQQEENDVTFRKQQEEAGRVQSDLRQQLEVCRHQIHELEDLRVQITARTEVEEKLVAEKEELISRLNIAEHALAIQKAGLKSKAEEKNVKEEEEVDGTVCGLKDSLLKQEAECDILKAELIETRSKLNETTHSCAQLQAIQSDSQAEIQHLQTVISDSQAQLQTVQSDCQTEIQNLQTMLSDSQAEIQHLQTVQSDSQAEIQQVKTLLSDSKAEIQHLQTVQCDSQAEIQHLRSLQSDSERLQAMSDSKAEIQHLQTVLSDSQAEIQRLHTDLQQKEAALSNLVKVEADKQRSMKELTPAVENEESSHIHTLRLSLETKQKEIDELTAERTTLQSTIAGLQQGLKEKERDYEVKLAELKNALERMEQGFTEKAAELNHVQHLCEVKEREKEGHMNQQEGRIQELEKECSDLLVSMDRLKASHADEVTSLQEELDADMSNKNWETKELEAAYQEEMRKICTEHAQKLSELELMHAELLHQKVGEVEARLMGDLAFLKGHHQEQMEELKANYNSEIGKIISDHHQILLSFKEGRAVDRTGLDDMEEDSLLIKIAELAPFLMQEAAEVNQLVQTSEQSYSGGSHNAPPLSSESSPNRNSMFTMLNNLKKMIEQVSLAKDGTDDRDWRRDLLDAVEQVLQQERQLLSTALNSSHSVPEGGDTKVEEGRERGDSDMNLQVLHDQLSHQAGLLQQLGTADRESLLAEIRQLRATINAMRDEQRDHNQKLLLQMEKSQQQAHMNSTQLQEKLDTARSRHQELEGELMSMRNRLAQKVAEAEAAHVDNSQIREECHQAQESLSNMEDSVRDARRTVLALHQEPRILPHSKEASLQESLNQLKEKMARDALQLQEISSDRALKYSELAAVQEELAQVKEEKEVTQQQNNELQLALTKKARLSQSDLKERDNEWEKLVAKEREISAVLRTSLNNKEKELTLTTDKMLQEKLASTKAMSDINSLNALLHKSYAEVEHLQLQLSGRADVKRGEQKEIDHMRRQSQHLESKYNSTIDELSQTEQSLVELKLERDAMRESLQRDCNRLQREVDVLKEEIKDSKVGVDQHASELEHKEFELSQKNLKISELQFQVRDQDDELGKLQAVISSCSDNGPDTSKILRLYAQYRQAEIHRKGLVFQKHYLQCHLDAFYQTQQVVLKMLADMGAPIHPGPVFPPPSKYPRPYARFRAAAAAVRATFRFRYLTRRKREYLESKSDKLNPRPVASERSGLGPSSFSVPHVTSSAPIISESHRIASHSIPSGISYVSHIPTALSNTSMRPMQQSHAADPLSRRKERSSKPSSIARLSNSKPMDSHKTKPGGNQSPIKQPKAGLQPHKLRQHVVSLPHRVPKKSALPKSMKENRNKNSKPGSLKTTKASTPPPSAEALTYDPQLLQYMEGLERVQTRLDKTKFVSRSNTQGH